MLCDLCRVTAAIQLLQICNANNKCNVYCRIGFQKKRERKRDRDTHYQMLNLFIGLFYFSGNYLAKYNSNNAPRRYNQNSLSAYSLVCLFAFVFVRTRVPKCSFCLSDAHCLLLSPKKKISSKIIT